MDNPMIPRRRPLSSESPPSSPEDTGITEATLTPEVEPIEEPEQVEVLEPEEFTPAPGFLSAQSPIAKAATAGFSPTPPISTLGLPEGVRTGTEGLGTPIGTVSVSSTGEPQIGPQPKLTSLPSIRQEQPLQESSLVPPTPTQLKTIRPAPRPKYSPEAEPQAPFPLEPEILEGEYAPFPEPRSEPRDEPRREPHGEPPGEPRMEAEESDSPYLADIAYQEELLAAERRYGIGQPIPIPPTSKITQMTVMQMPLKRSTQKRMGRRRFSPKHKASFKHL